MSRLSNCSLIGIPDHQGVINVGGRIGQAHGPLAFRRVLARMAGSEPVRERLHDVGDLRDISSDVLVNHRRAADLIRDAHRATGLSIVVGGGHDHGYSQLLGVSEALKSGKGKKALRLGCINIDPHLDVRKPAPLVTSGSPFYLALESGILHPSRFIEFGIQSHCNAPALWKYIAQKKVEIVPFEKLRGGKAAKAFAAALKRLSLKCDVIVVSLDLDSAAQAYAPGVSAPQAEGFTPTDVIEICELAGRAKKVSSLGIFELNPAHDLDDRTARLGATAAWHFLERALAR
jgi:formiminoglutamase